MGILETARSRFRALCADRGVDLGTAVTVQPLTPDAAIGERASNEFVIRKGRETVIEAGFGGDRGQAFTDAPSAFTGTLAEVLDLPLDEVRNRAILVAAMNAVLRQLGAAEGTVHCRNEDPTNCGPELAQAVEKRFGHVRVGLVGLQPAILAALVGRFGAGNICVVDRNDDTIGGVKHGVAVRDGDTDLPRLIDACDVALVTGSTVVNGTMDAVVAQLEAAGRPYVFFGNTIAGCAALLDLDRLCPFGR